MIMTRGSDPFIHFLHLGCQACLLLHPYGQTFFILHTAAELEHLTNVCTQGPGRSDGNLQLFWPCSRCQLQMHIQTLYTPRSGGRGTIPRTQSLISQTSAQNRTISHISKVYLISWETVQQPVINNTAGDAQLNYSPEVPAHISLVNVRWRQTVLTLFA
jgi:hypothetical protein